MSEPEAADISGKALASLSDGARALLDALAQRRLDGESVPDELVQRLLTLGVKLYAAKHAAGDRLFPFTGADAVTSTEVGVVVSHALRGVQMDLFELVMWQGLV